MHIYHSFTCAHRKIYDDPLGHMRWYRVNMFEKKTNGNYKNWTQIPLEQWPHHLSMQMRSADNMERKQALPYMEEANKIRKWVYFFFFNAKDSSMTIYTLCWLLFTAFFFFFFIFLSILLQTRSTKCKSKPQIIAICGYYICACFIFTDMKVITFLFCF